VPLCVSLINLTPGEPGASPADVFVGLDGGLMSDPEMKPAQD
jgi:hypothetical protein